jgi:LysR family nitrogen assimilation transcriptional regulator
MPGLDPFRAPMFAGDRVSPEPKIPDFRVLHSFLAVARTGNFGRAARDLNVSQSAISRQIQKLEDHFGTQLFERHGHGTSLLPEGSLLLDRLNHTLEQILVPVDGSVSPSFGSGRLTFGISPELAPLVVPYVVKRSRRRWPDVILDVQEAGTAKLEERLLNRRIDVAVLQDPAGLDALECEAVVSEPLGLVVGTQSSLAETGGSVRFRQLVNLPLLLPDPTHWICRKIERAAFQRGVRLQAFLQVDSLSLAKELVRKELGVAVLPRVAVQSELARGDMVFVPILSPSLTVIHAVVHQRGTSQREVLDLASELGAIMKELVQSQIWTGATLV